MTTVMQNVQTWREQHNRTPEQIAAANKAWAAKQAARRQAEELREKALRLKTPIALAMLRAGVL